MTSTITRHVDLTVADLVEHAIRRNEGVLADNGALVVKTGHRTGRSPTDRFIVKEASTEQDIQWGNVNRPFDPVKFSALWARVSDFIATKEHFVSHLEVGADPEHYIPMTVTTETAWQHIFAKNLFITPAQWNKSGKETWQIPERAFVLTVIQSVTAPTVTVL